MAYSDATDKYGAIEIKYGSNSWYTLIAYEGKAIMSVPNKSTIIGAYIKKGTIIRWNSASINANCKFIPYVS